MATTTSITTTYAGEKAAGYISAALLSANTIENGGITVKPNVKFKQVIKRLSTTDLIADGSCDFAATDTVTLDIIRYVLFLLELLLIPGNGQLKTALIQTSLIHKDQ